jgi:hypothetical protein
MLLGFVVSERGIEANPEKISAIMDMGPIKNLKGVQRVTGCRMDLPGPTASVGTRTDYSMGPWDYSACVTRHLMAWGARTTVEKYSDRKLYMSCTM